MSQLLDLLWVSSFISASINQLILLLLVVVVVSLSKYIFRSIPLIGLHHPLFLVILIIVVGMFTKGTSGRVCIGKLDDDAFGFVIKVDSPL